MGLFSAEKTGTVSWEYKNGSEQVKASVESVSIDGHDGYARVRDLLKAYGFVESPSTNHRQTMNGREYDVYRFTDKQNHAVHVNMDKSGRGNLSTIRFINNYSTTNVNNTELLKKVYILFQDQTSRLLAHYAVNVNNENYMEISYFQDLMCGLGYTKVEGKNHVIGSGLSAQGIEFLKNFELKDEGVYKRLFEHDENGNATGVYPYYVHDGGITFGFGHYVNEAEYKQDPSEKALVDKYVPLNTPFDDGLSINYYPVVVPNSTVVPMSVVNELYKNDVNARAKNIDNWLVSENITLTQAQFDALMPFKYLYGNLLEVGIDDLIMSGASKEEWEALFVHGAYSRNGTYSARNQAAIDLFFSGEYK